MKKTVCTALLACLLFPAALLAADTVPFPAIGTDDRILVLAPHPDDETIGAAGPIMHAQKAGAQVKFACFTSGDHNELSFILYEKRLTVRQGEFLHMGEVRRKETLAALALLGVKPADVVFFGYPDFGTLSILMRYWGTTRPYRSIMTRIDKVSYPEAYSPGAPYVGESVLRDLKKLITDFKPTKIFVSHPADTNSDHQALYLFLRIALWDLEKTIRPEVYPYLIHVVGWPRTQGHHEELEQIMPPPDTYDVIWQRFDLTPDEEAQQQKMIACYKSQLVFNPGYLYAFNKKNEFFGDCPETVLFESKGAAFLWQDVVPLKQGAGPDEQARLAFSRTGDSLYIKLVLKTAFTRRLGIRVLLVPYSAKTNFAAMPKLNITIGMGGLQIKDRQKVVFIKGASIAVGNKVVVLKIPLASLGNPDRILSRTWARFSRYFPFKAPAWRVIRMGQN